MVPNKGVQYNGERTTENNLQYGTEMLLKMYKQGAYCSVLMKTRNGSHPKGFSGWMVK